MIDYKDGAWLEQERARINAMHDEGIASINEAYKQGLRRINLEYYISVGLVWAGWVAFVVFLAWWLT